MRSTTDRGVPTYAGHGTTGSATTPAQRTGHGCVWTAGVARIAHKVQNVDPLRQTYFLNQFLHFQKKFKFSKNFQIFKKIFEIFFENSRKSFFLFFFFIIIFVFCVF